MNVNFALDWSPNALHAGYLIAQAEGYFRDEQLNVTFSTPEDDQYAVTPAKRLAQKQAHVAVSPSESVISFRTLPEPVPLVAIATALQEDASAIVVRDDSDIRRPADLDGRSFASYDARFENDIVRQLVRADGGQGDIRVVNPAKLEMWRTVAEGEADATWVFLPWEGPQAQRQANTTFRAFQMRDYGIPYGYSPLLITHHDTAEQEPDMLRALLRAAEKGWELVIDQPEQAAEFLHRHIKHPNFQDLERTKESLTLLQPAVVGSEDQWGVMQSARWTNWLAWMTNTEVLKDTDGQLIRTGQIDTSSWYSNQFLP